MGKGRDKRKRQKRKAEKHEEAVQRGLQPNAQNNNVIQLPELNDTQAIKQWLAAGK